MQKNRKSGKTEGETETKEMRIKISNFQHGMSKFQVLPHGREPAGHPHMDDPNFEVLF